MKVAIVSFGHADSALPMAKAISKHAEIDMFFMFTPDSRNNNFAFFDGKDHKFGLQDEKTVKERFAPEVFTYIQDKFKIHAFVFRSTKLKQLRNWFCILKVCMLLRKFDLVHINGKNTFVYLLRLFSPFKKKIYTIHDLENHSGEKAINKLSANFNKYLLTSNQQVIIQNKFDFEVVKKEYPQYVDNFHFIPFGVLDIYREFKNDKIEVPEIDILFFGRISLYKGLEYFVDAAKKLKKDFPKIKVGIAGSGKIYFDATDIENDESFFIVNKYIENSEMVELIKASKIIICPYIDATQSGVIMTAFAFDKPVIATEIGGFIDVVKDGVNGYFIPTKNSEQIYQKVKMLLEDTQIIKDLSENINQDNATGNFSWNVIGQNYYDVYNKAIGK